MRALRSRRFADDDEMKEAVNEWLRNNAKQFFFSDVTRKLVDSRKKCVEAQGDYAGK
jgi:hypothetical protein